jgi:hypothetical protein
VQILTLNNKLEQDLVLSIVVIAVQVITIVIVQLVLIVAVVNLALILAIAKHVLVKVAKLALLQVTDTYWDVMVVDTVVHSMD